MDTTLTPAALADAALLDDLAPVLTGQQAQGDVFVLPGVPPRAWAREPVPAEGIAVVRGEIGRNTHLLQADGPVTWAPNPAAGRRAEDLDLGALTVPEDATGYLVHPEHANLGIGPGAYLLRRQRELAPTTARPVYVRD